MEEQSWTDMDFILEKFSMPMNISGATLRREEPFFALLRRLRRKSL